MVLPLILSLRFLIKEKEKEGVSQNAQNSFWGVLKTHRRQHADWGRSATAAAFRPIRGLRHSMARLFSDGDPFNLDEKEIDLN